MERQQRVEWRRQRQLRLQLEDRESPN
jgi:hypothetical protein